jgi:uncharacterized caspase-like protein
MDIYAAQHALIIGINDYPKAQNLEGAVNDAKLIRDALRKLKILTYDNEIGYIIMEMNYTFQ